MEGENEDLGAEKIVSFIWLKIQANKQTNTTMTRKNTQTRTDGSPEFGLGDNAEILTGNWQLAHIIILQGLKNSV